MKTIIRMSLSAVLAIAMLGVAAPTAGAEFLTPANHDFGSRTVGTTSAPQAFTLGAECQTEVPPGVCFFGEFVVPAVSTTGDFAQTNSCPSMSFLFGDIPPVTCTINVTFTPTAAGPRAGTLSAGGLSRPLSGTGLAPPTPTPTPTFNLQAAIKKCKKNFPKGPKRKKCIKKAKARAG